MKKGCDDMLITEVPLKSNGESARFFDDHLEFYGTSISYDEIATLATSNSITIHTVIFIPMGRSFDGMVTFKMNNGKTHNINMNAMSVFGIPIIRNPRKNEKLFPPLYDAVYSIVAKSMAQKYIDEINGGGTVEVTGLTVNSSEATFKSKKAVAFINKDNYRECQVANGYGATVATVYDKQGDTLWSSSIWSNKNVLLIPYILDAVFGG